MPSLRSDTTFRPRRVGKRESILAMTFLADGATPAGILVSHDERKFHNLALCLDVTDGVRGVEPGDNVLFAEGTAEPLVTAKGERLFWIAQSDICDTFEARRA